MKKFPKYLETIVCNILTAIFMAFCGLIYAYLKGVDFTSIIEFYDWVSSPNTLVVLFILLNIYIMTISIKKSKRKRYFENNNKIYIIPPTFQIKRNALDKQYSNFIVYEEMSSIVAIFHYMSNIKPLNGLIVAPENLRNSRREDDYNTFSMGGPFVNKYTYDIINKCFPNVRISCNEDRYEEYDRLFKESIENRNNTYLIDIQRIAVPVKRNEHRRYIRYQVKNMQSEIEINDINEELMIIVKLNQRRFNDNPKTNKNTIYLVFGLTAHSTQRAMKLLFEEYRVLKSITGDNKEYFLIIRCNKNGKIDKKNITNIFEDNIIQEQESLQKNT